LGNRTGIYYNSEKEEDKKPAQIHNEIFDGNLRHPP